MASTVTSLGSPQGVSLMRLPPEMISLISSFLTNKDRKLLRLTCKTVSELTPLSFPRVFLSSNSLNIKVFRAVADHPKFRQQVTEIIWDDARLDSVPSLWNGLPPFMDHEGLEIDDSCPRWFAKACQNNFSRRYDQKERPDQLSLRECWAYYSNLLNDQQEVIRAEDDEKTFIYGLERFPRLKRVTITPATHGWLYSPLYETPMIRDFPYGFNYPIVRGWDVDFQGSAFTDPRPEEPLNWTEASKQYKEKWRGVRIVLRVLSKAENHNVSELNFDSSGLPFGVPCTIFEAPCDEYKHFAAILARPGFQSLDLSLHVGYSPQQYPVFWQSELLFEALSSAKDLTQINLSKALDDDWPEEYSFLRQNLPIESWPNLRHFGISNLTIKVSRLIDTLKSLPESIESVDLGLLTLQDYDEGTRYDFLEKIRDEVGCNYREKKPTVTLRSERWSSEAGKFIQVVEELNDFLYGEGENPAMKELAHVKPGIGMMVDLLEPEYTQPN